jgi:HSP20 family protein
MATRFDPFTALYRMDRDFDELVRRTWGGAQPVRSGFVPPVEMVVEGDDVVLRLELPGIDPTRDVDLEVQPGKLTIRGERRAAETEQRDGVLVRELRYGAFHREFGLPEGIGEDAVEASYDQGMLTIHVRGVVRRPPEPKKVTIRGTQNEKQEIRGSKADKQEISQ